MCVYVCPLSIILYVFVCFPLRVVVFASVDIDLQPGQEVVGDGGAMNWMDGQFVWDRDERRRGFVCACVCVR